MTAEVPTTPVDPDANPDAPARARAVRQATRLSIAAAGLLVLLKVFGWAATGSVSLLASLLDSGLDLIASLAVFFAVRWISPSTAGDGRGKAEAFAGLFQAGLVMSAALFVSWEAVDRILDPRLPANGPWGVGIMIVSLLVTLGLVWAQTRAIRLSGSQAIRSDRAHYSADLASNLVALIGIGSATFLSAAPLDAAAGLIVAVWLLWGAFSVLREAADRLLDREMSEEARSALTQAVLADSRVRAIQQLQTRASGTSQLVALVIDLDPDLTLAEAGEIIDGAKARVVEVAPLAEVRIYPGAPGGHAADETE